MTPEYQLDDNYRLAPTDRSLALPDQLPELPYEYLPDRCAVSIADWVPDREQQWSIVGPPTCSVCLILEGVGKFSIANGKSFTITPGSVFIFRTSQPTLGINQYAANRRILTVDFRYPHSLFTAYESQFLHKDGNRCCNPKVLFQKHKITRNLLRIAHEVLACQMHGMARELFLRGKALEVLSYLADDAAKTVCNTTPLTRNQFPVRLARQILEERYAEKWTLRRLAQEVGTNERKLKEGFRELLQTTFHRCLEEIRLTHACRLLTGSRHSVTDIGMRIGYVNSSHFARTFKAKKGVSPRQWRDRVGDK